MREIARTAARSLRARVIRRAGRSGSAEVGLDIEDFFEGIEDVDELAGSGLEVEDAGVWFKGSGTGSKGSGDVLGEGVAEDEDMDSSVNKSESISEG
jgi:hypothetical protein